MRDHLMKFQNKIKRIAFIDRVTTTPNPPPQMSSDPLKKNKMTKHTQKKPQVPPIAHPNPQMKLCLSSAHLSRMEMNAELEHLLLLYLRSHQILSLQGQNPKIFACGALTFHLYIYITIRISRKFLHF